MAKKNNSAMQSLVKKRDKAFDRLSFNEQYPRVYEAKLDEKNQKELKKLETRNRKALLPLEIAARSTREVNEWRIEKEMKAAEEKQKLPRRAAKVRWKKAVEARGEEAAAGEYQKELDEFDRKLADKRKALEAKYPLEPDTPPTADAIRRFEEETQAARGREDRLKAAQEANKQEKLAKLETRLNAENEKIRAEFEECNRKLKEFSTLSEEEFGAETVLSIRNLKMYFAGVKAVDDISFDIRNEEIFGLIGPNGAGKTTIFNCVTQFYKPTAGNVYYRDLHGCIVDLTNYKTFNVIKTGIARTFQNLEMVIGLSVLDNLLVGAHSLYQSSLVEQIVHSRRMMNEEEVNRAKAVKILERLGLLQYKDMHVLGLPYGVLKKIELARSLMTNPKIIILDEPAAGLNDSETQELANTIRQIRDDYHCTIFLVEHDMSLVMNLCERICVCSFGKELAIGTPDEIRKNPLVQQAYLGDESEAK